MLLRLGFISGIGRGGPSVRSEVDGFVGSWWLNHETNKRDQRNVNFSQFYFSLRSKAFEFVPEYSASCLFVLLSGFPRTSGCYKYKSSINLKLSLINFVTIYKARI